MDPRHRRKTVVLLAAAAGVLAAVTATFAALYTARQDDAGRLKAQIAATEGSIVSAQARLSTVESAVTGLNSTQSQLQSTNTKLHACADPAKDSVTAAEANNQAALEQALNKVLTSCGR